MAATPPQVVQLTCPNCRTPFRAQIFTLVDVGRQPELKDYLLSGHLNLAVCPNCGLPTPLGAPLVYHDPAKQLFLVHFPQQLNARPEEQERFIGDATSFLMRDLPQDAPRGYLLAPRRFLTLNSLVETILEADGISRETIEAQRKRMELIGLLADAYEQSEEQLAQVVEQHKDELDLEFFAMFSAFVEANTQGGQDASTKFLLDLRDQLIELTGFDTSRLEGFDEEDVPLGEVIEQLSSASDEELEQVVGELRPALDYSFFEAWTAQIEAAERAGDQATADRLTARRARILETVERMDKQAQELFEAGAAILKQVLAADDPAEALRAQGDKIDDVFLQFLENNIEAARHVGNAEMADRLAEIQRLALKIAQESLSPEDRFISELLQAETPQAATKLLRQNPAMATTAFVKRLNELADQYANDGRKPSSERLRQLGREAGAMLF